MPFRARVAAPLTALAALAFLAGAARPAAAQWQFTDVSVSSGAGVAHALVVEVTPVQKMSGGVACGDYNNDGWLDLYHIGGDAGSNQLLRNNGDGTFSDVAAAAGVTNPGQRGNGATFADWNGDGWLDLYVGGIDGSRLRFYENNGDGTFTNTTDSAGVMIGGDIFSGSFGDPDNDGDLDLVIAHWSTGQAPGHFWRNDGSTGFATKFSSVDVAWGYTNWAGGGIDYSFAYNFVDLNSDGWTDVVCASDFITSHVFMNDGDGTFTETTDPAVLTDHNGMGSAVADYDKDGDLDWFVTSIYDTTVGKDGNRMYRNDGNGVFEDASDHANIRDGQWGWGATFGDFNNDGWLDIYHVNGWQNFPEWQDDPSRLFVSNGDATFTEMAASLGANTISQGRGVVSFDYDRDGDLDLFFSNCNESAVLLRNDLPSGNWLGVKLIGPAPNTEQIGARITATVAGSSQLTELHCGNNFNSQNPVEAHFGLGAATQVDQLVVEWTDGSVTTLDNVAANQRLVLDQTAAVSAPLPEAAREGSVRLLGTSPNPFRSGTSIRFSLQRPGPVTAAVYDTAGRRVRTLLDGRRAAGSHGIAWDGRTDGGDRAASGIYQFVIRSGNGIARGKLSLIR